MDWTEKQEHLYKLAESDEIYNVWKNSYHEAEMQFREYADSQQEEIRQILWQYAESGKMMYQRLVNLACIYMEYAIEESQA